ncbi:unnamed protein product [Meloidogyne enterolobii]|uniref:Uncharacterized protein n=3 Tax=Meloidogyne enterolobii TaxID=390850 RepID=A0ACB1ATI6_MELEN
MLIYNKEDPKIKTQVKPAGECDCPSCPDSKMVFFHPVAKITTGKDAGSSPINMQCSIMESFCVCDDKGVCWKLTNALAQLVINSHCDPTNLSVCHMYVRMNNIEPKTQTLESDNGQKITLDDQLMKIPGTNRNMYKPMISSATYYIKATSIKCLAEGETCAPIKCESICTSTPTTPTTPTTTTTPTTPTTETSTKKPDDCTDVIPSMCVLPKMCKIEDNDNFFLKRLKKSYITNCCATCHAITA